MSLKWALKRFVHSTRFRQIIILGTYIVPFTCPSQTKQFVNTYCYKLFINQSYISFSLCRIEFQHAIQQVHNKMRWCKIKKIKKKKTKPKRTQSKNVKYLLSPILTTILPPQAQKKRGPAYMTLHMIHICFLLSSL